MTKLIAACVIFVLAIVTIPLLWPGDDTTAPEASPMLPWQIEIREDGGSQVFGLQTGQSVLDDARPLFGPDVEIAIVAPPGRPPLLEAYYENVNAGFITGRMILTADVDEDTIGEMRARALKESYMESVTRKVKLHPDDLAEARRMPIRVITFIPSADLDEQVIVARFGPPERRIRFDDDTEHFLYPGLGLDIALNRRGKEVLQYVAPADFALLLDPLLNRSPQSDVAPESGTETKSESDPDQTKND